ncbi:MAG: beta-lactamase family protein [Acidobacteria bacterium]|nr:beta-lactamase family protein [Acidobacteriota bacterium]
MKQILPARLLICAAGVHCLIAFAAHSTNAQQRDLDSAFRLLFDGHVGGSVLVIDGGKIIFQHAYGLANVEENISATPATNYRIASVSKQFTALAVMLLVERKKPATAGRLSLDDTLDHFFPGFPAYGQKIRVRHLLNHTSGLPDYEDLISPGTTLQVHDVDVLQLLLETQQPKFAAGAKFQYSNSGYALLALIVEKVSGHSFYRFLEQEIFQPARMSHTVSYVRGVNDVSNRAFGHSRDGGGWKRTDQSVTSAVLGDGGIYTSVEDFAKWIAALDAGKFLRQSSYQQMYSPTVLVAGETEAGAPGAAYGFGWFVGKFHDLPAVWHSGNSRGFAHYMIRFPQRRAAVVVFMNENDAPARDICERIAELALLK